MGRGPEPITSSMGEPGELRLMRDPLDCELGTCDIRPPSFLTNRELMTCPFEGRRAFDARFVHPAAERVRVDYGVERGLSAPGTARQRFAADPEGAVFEAMLGDSTPGRGDPVRHRSAPSTLGHRLIA
ncbi:hypothetical protein GCM10010306_091020 [Streptomyces umbrinus]|nr:hypothetical protein GCM10010306_091020 [Streptomyces umbrinus]